MLTTAQRYQLASKPNSTIQTVPAPVGGWNTRDALDAMDPTDAVVLDNFYPNAGGVFMRNGYQSWATGLGGTVKTLAEYNAGSTLKFIGAAGGKFFDITNTGPVGSPLATGFTSDAWQTVPFLSRVFFANGVDTMQVYDGATMANSTFTGVALNTLVGCAVYQNRLFFWPNNSTGFWFAPLNSITGALAFYDLQAFCPHGGNLVSITTVSHDGGNGVLDFIVFSMSSGDSLLYFGNDPSNPDAWQLIGIYRISPPVSPRAVCQYGADSFITTADDHVPLQQQLVALKVGALPPRSKISTAVQNAVIANRNGFGWQALYYPAGRRLIFNIPNPDGTFYQHVQNTGMPSQPWCRFTGMNAFCWGLFNNKLFFGAAGGVVYQADVGNLDNSNLPIMASGQQAWTTFNLPARKRLTAIRPIIQSQGNINYSFDVGYDYGAINIVAAAASPDNGSPWNTSPWNTSPWSPELTVDSRWRISGGSGTALSVALALSSRTSMAWLRTDFRYEPGIAL